MELFLLMGHPFNMDPKGIIEVETSRGKIRIVDTHIFTIIVPDHEQLSLEFWNESISFGVKNWLDRAKETKHDGTKKEVDNPKT